MKYEIPVYLFTGFLEAGKTEYIQKKALQDPEFCGRDRILLLICEEGFSEYQPELFSADLITPSIAAILVSSIER